MPDNPAPANADRPKWRGTDRRYLLQRPKDAGRDDLVAAVEGRRISAYRCAVNLGWLAERKPSQTTLDHGRSKRRQQETAAVLGSGALAHSDVLRELWLGPNAAGSIFHSRAELAAAWAKHREEVMATWGSNGRRPQEWDEFEAPIDVQRDDNHEKSTLYTRGLLGADEARQVEAEWRQLFDQAQSRFRSIHKRRQYYQNCDIPEVLCNQWEAEKLRKSLK